MLPQVRCTWLRSWVKTLKLTWQYCESQIREMDRWGPLSLVGKPALDVDSIHRILMGEVVGQRLETQVFRREQIL